MNPVLTCGQIRQYDRIAIERFGIPSLVLMENAARGASDALCRFHGGTPDQVTVICGPGNNGGDGLVMARHLHLRGATVQVVLLSQPEKISQDARVNLRILQQTALPVETGMDQYPQQIGELVADAGWIVDAILGTGSRLPLRAPLDEIVETLNLAPGRRMAVDLPTGLPADSDGDCGLDLQSVFRADLTATLVARKPVMATATGQQVCGEIRVVDIGAPPEVFDYLEPNQPEQQEI